MSWLSKGLKKLVGTKNYYSIKSTAGQILGGSKIPIVSGVGKALTAQVEAREIAKAREAETRALEAFYTTQPYKEPSGQESKAKGEYSGPIRGTPTGTGYSSPLVIFGDRGAQGAVAPAAGPTIIDRGGGGGIGSKELLVIGGIIAVIFIAGKK